MTPVLRLENVTKRYQEHLAVDSVSFDMPKGCVFGLLGPNGAGKTTTIRMITTILGADEGAIYLDGEKVDANTPSRIGYMPEERGLYKKMKVGDHLMYLAQLKGMPKQMAKQELGKWMEKFEITSWWNKKVEELSKGMQQKVQFIATVVHRPRLLILDEPFSGLDPINTNLIKDEIDELNRQGTSIIFSTHRMEQVEEVCEHIVLINQGKNVLDGSVKNIRNSYKDNQFQVAFQGQLPADVQAHFELKRNNDSEVTIQLQEGQNSNEVLSYFLEKGILVTAFNEILPSINDIFIKAVNS